ncbi:MAG: hypothetical protein HYR56_33735 [Acidobacteria bacterium]|nr:hypothetical protein [Acidobacteriota bacterium]MBI3422922.1 hypothetical protein [Acidobacteriota bacterium]
MKRFVLALTIVMGLVWLAARGTALAQTQSKPAANKALTPDEVIKQFTQRESELFETWKDYAYKQESRMQVLGPANTVSGEFYQVSEFVFNDSGKRIERILKAPPSTLDQAGLTMTAEDKNALVNLQPFALTAQELPNYTITYVGKEKVDDLNAYVFDVMPKVLGNQSELRRLKSQKIEGKYFQGRIWVDDQDLQVVKSQGKVVPEFKQRFPKFETYRENIDGRYWFPTYTYSDDTLYFEEGGSAHVRMVVKYKDYRQFQSDVKITGVEEVKDEPKAEVNKAGDKATDKTGSKPADKKDEKKPEEPAAKPKRPRP